MSNADDRPLTGRLPADGTPLWIDAYEKAGGYQGLRRALKVSPQEVQQAVADSNLRGRGGAGFFTGKKWSFVPMGDDARRPKYLAVNADEMEPGTMKDRLLLESNPHLVIEGAAIASYAIQADEAYLFLRWAYKTAAGHLRQALAEAYDRGYLGADILGSGYGLEMRLHASAGRYMCGEEDGLLDALEGKRAIPRAKPPYAVVCGLWGKPTVVNNVETLSCVPSIVERGADWFKGLSRTDEGGTKLYGASGRVKRPGVWELPLGTSLGELVEEHAGGMQDGYALRALLPGGASTALMTKDQFDVAMDFESAEKAGSRLGTGTMVVIDDRVCPVGVQFSLAQFFARESCGWCTPCREGLPWVARTLNAIEEGRGEEGDLEILEHHVQQIKMHHTFCALAPGAMAPLASGLKVFRDDFERHIREKRCPWR